ncbi:MAG: PAS domain-containing protein [Patescibacteria group bacterium]
MVREIEKDEKIKELMDDIDLMEIYVKDFRDLFSFIPFPVCFANPQGIILEVNPSFLKITGYKEGEIVGEKLFDFFRDEEKEEIKNTIEENPVENRETSIISKEGEKIPISAFIRKNKREESNSMGGIFFSFFDLREINEKKEKLEQKMKEIKKINRLMEGREIKMLELKKRIKELEEKLAEKE